MPNGFWQPYRTVVLDGRAQDFIDRHATPGARFAEHWDGIVWLLCRTPEIGTARDRHDPTRFVIHVSAGSGLAGTKDVWVLYSFTDDEVIVHGVSVPDDPDR
jgi:hypothetical protein